MLGESGHIIIQKCSFSFVEHNRRQSDSFSLLEILGLVKAGELSGFSEREAEHDDSLNHEFAGRFVFLLAHELSQTSRRLCIKEKLFNVPLSLTSKSLHVPFGKNSRLHCMCENSFR